MTIGIIVAMSKELRLILPMLSQAYTRTIGSTTFHLGTIGSNKVVVMECGIGKVNAAIGAVTLIDNFEPDLVINTGVAAGAATDVRVMDTVVASSLAHHDFWCIGEEWGRVPGCPREFKAYTFDDIVKGPDVKRGLIATGELFISNKAEVDAIKEHFPQVKAIDMESAAIAQACFLRGVNFFCMRVISDSPWTSHDNSSQYEDFWEEAPERSFKHVKTLLENL